MNLYLREVIHPQAHENYRVILTCEDGEFEIGSIGVQHGAAWSWGIDTVIRVPECPSGKSFPRKGAMRVSGEIEGAAGA